jgi:glycosyltransferase involved in cell wall biosynthesis
VAGDVPGCRAIVRDGVTGWLVPTENVDALSRAIERALSDPSARASMGEAARRAVQDPFGVDLVLDRYRDIFRDLGRTLPNESSR